MFLCWDLTVVGFPLSSVPGTRGAEQARQGQVDLGGSAHGDLRAVPKVVLALSLPPLLPGLAPVRRALGPAGQALCCGRVQVRR